MMRPAYSVILLTAPILLLSCHGQKNSISSLPAGQVVAQVGNRDITINDLNTELSGKNFGTVSERKRAEAAALQGLIARTILANVAREKKLDQEPSYVMQQHRANDILLAQNLQAQISGKVPTPAEGEVTAYIAAHPAQFANRKIYTLDQIKFRAPDDMTALRGYSPLKSLSDVERKLIEDRTTYQRQTATLDVLDSEPDLVVAMAKLPADEVFIVPKNEVVYANHIIATRLEPFNGPRARNYAAIALQNQRIEKATVDALGDRIKAARATVKYQPGYAPARLVAR